MRNLTISVHSGADGELSSRFFVGPELPSAARLPAILSRLIEAGSLHCLDFSASMQLTASLPENSLPTSQRTHLPASSSHALELLQQRRRVPTKPAGRRRRAPVRRPTARPCTHALARALHAAANSIALLIGSYYGSIHILKYSNTCSNVHVLATG